MRVPWNARTSNQSILKEISPKYSLGGLMLRLKLQYFGYFMWRTDSLEKTLMLRMIEGEGDNRVWDGWMASLTRCTWVWVSSRSWWWTGKLGVLLSMGSQRVGQTDQQNWTEPYGRKQVWHTKKRRAERVLINIWVLVLLVHKEKFYPQLKQWFNYRNW